MSYTSKNASSLTGAMAEVLSEWFANSNKKIKINELVNGDEYLSLERDEEINILVLKLFSSICNELSSLQHKLYDSLYGKNMFVRREALLSSCKIVADIIENHGLEYFKEIYQKKAGQND
jgi:hypothetical protein